MMMKWEAKQTGVSEQPPGPGAMPPTARRFLEKHPDLRTETKLRMDQDSWSRVRVCELLEFNAIQASNLNMRCNEVNEYDGEEENKSATKRMKEREVNKK